MSEKQQRTAASMREKMINRYGDGLHHKHDKLHIPYRHHCRSHPIQPHTIPDEVKENCPTGLQREYKLRKIRKRLDKGRFQ